METRTYRPRTYQTQSHDHADPEHNVIDQRPISYPRQALKHHNRHLQHHHNKAIPSELTSYATHDKFVGKRRDEEGDAGRGRPRELDAAGGAIDVPAEEVVDGYVPFAAEF